MPSRLVARSIPSLTGKTHIANHPAVPSPTGFQTNTVRVCWLLGDLQAGTALGDLSLLPATPLLLAVMMTTSSPTVNAWTDRHVHVCPV